MHYLHRMSRARSPKCWYCNVPKDDAHHTFFVCPNWETLRAEVTGTIGRRLVLKDVQEFLCGPPASELPRNFTNRANIMQKANQQKKLLLDMIMNILIKKEDDERIVQSEARRRR